MDTIERIDFIRRTFDKNSFKMQKAVPNSAFGKGELRRFRFSSSERAYNYSNTLSVYPNDFDICNRDAKLKGAYSYFSKEPNFLVLEDPFIVRTLEHVETASSFVDIISILVIKILHCEKIYFATIRFPQSRPTPNRFDFVSFSRLKDEEAIIEHLRPDFKNPQIEKLLTYANEFICKPH